MQDVANAIGAALGTVGATVDIIESLELEEGGEGEEGKEKEERAKRARLSILERAREQAISEAVKKGAVRSQVYIQSENVVDVAYVAKKVRVRVKAIGPLPDLNEQRVHVTVKDNPHWPYASAEDKEKDKAAKLTCPKVEGGSWVRVMYHIETKFEFTILHVCA